MLPGWVMYWIIRHHIARLDEFQRKRQFAALAISFAGTALSTFRYDFLENVDFPKLSIFTVWLLMAAH